MKDYSVIIENLTEGIITNLEEAYDYGYKQGYEDGRNNTEYMVSSAYKHGMEESWECARTIINKYGNDFGETRKDIFGYGGYKDVINNLTASEVISKIKEYEQQKQDAIQVGDEVVLNILADHENQKAIIIAYDGKSYPYNVLMDNGDSEWVKEIAIECKTGRHFDQIAEVLAEMRGESE